MCCGGFFEAPPYGGTGNTKFGFTIPERVRIDDVFFKDWHGHVRAFNESSVAVDLDEPPPGHLKNGQWFNPEKLQKTPA